MKNKTKKIYFFISLILFLIISSCRTEDDLSINPSSESTLGTNSMAANLMARVALKDGSIDNIIDNASNLTIELPINVTANGLALDITNEDDYQDIENIFNLSNSDTDTLIIDFPITVIFEDFSRVIVNSKVQLDALSSGENIDDMDIECIDIVYPINASVFNENTEVISTITLNDDNETYNFINDLNKYAAVNIIFPINVSFSDDSTQIINSIQGLEAAISSSDNTCDEDDNNDFVDDDICIYCTTTEINNVFAQCSEWTVEKLKINQLDIQKTYLNYLFTFNNDGTLNVTSLLSNYIGTWSTSGTGVYTQVDINVVGLPDFNKTWDLVKINTNAIDKKVELRLGTDRLRFASDCTN